MIFKNYLSLDVFVLFSLVLQFVLLGSSLRLKIRFFRMNVSSLELLQMAVAQYVVASFPNYNSIGGRTGELRVFWLPFIILHLGGPSTRTSLTLADNELWLRFAPRFFTLTYSFGLVLYQRSFLQNDLRWPTALMFMAGALSYCERVICCFLARLTKFRESTLRTPHPAAEISSTVVGDSAAGSVGPAGSDSDDKLSQVKIVKEAYGLFHEFQGLFVNSVFTYKQRDKVRRRFLRIKNAEDAFSICEAELSFAYDVFYTKAILIHKYFNCYLLLSLVSLSLQLASLVLWIQIDKTVFHRSSVIVTYLLVVGSLAHFLLSLFIYATSDWCIAKVIEVHEGVSGATSKLSSLYEYVYTARRPLSGIRWSRSIFQLNLLRNAVEAGNFGSNVCNTPRKCSAAPSIKELTKFLFDTSSFDTGIFETIVDPSARPCSATVHSTKGLMKFIFEQLAFRSQYAEHPKHVEELCSARGMWVLDQLYQEHTGFGSDTFRRWISDVEYEESLILWHLATTLCYYNCEEKGNGQISDLRELSKMISDYMLYLLIRRPAMIPLSEGTSGNIIFNDTLDEGRRFCSKKEQFNDSNPGSRLEDRLREASAKILNIDIISRNQITGDESEALLFDASVLAKNLRGLSNKWEIIGKVLMEMLFYSAAHSTPSEHLDSLNDGGELLTLVWLLMAHLGLGKHFRHKKRRDRATQIVNN